MCVINSPSEPVRQPESVARVIAHSPRHMNRDLTRPGIAVTELGGDLVEGCFSFDLLDRVA